MSIENDGVLLDSTSSNASNEKEGSESSDIEMERVIEKLKIIIN